MTAAAAADPVVDRPGWRARLAAPGTEGILLAGLVALALRVLWVSWVSHHPPASLYDPARYAGYAQQIAQGKGYTEPLTGQATAYYPPGYPWFLGIIAWVQHHTPLGDYLPLLAGLVQAVLGALTAVFAGLVARRLWAPRAGVVAAFVVALYPNLVFHAGALLSETLYNFLFLAFLVVLLDRPWGSGFTTARVAGASVLFGAALLVRPISAAVLPVLVLAWWLTRVGGRVVLRWTAVTVAVLAACVLPWTIRNAVRMHAFVPMSTNTGDNLCIGHHPGANGAFSQSEWCNTGQGVQFGSRSEVRNDRLKTDKALRWARSNVGAEPRLVVRRAYYMFKEDHDGVLAVESYRYDWWMDHDTERLLIRLADGAYAVVAVVGLVGLARLVGSRRPEAIFVVLAAAATAAVPLAFFGDQRFKVPVVPILCIAAAVAVTRPTVPDAERPDETG